MGTLPATIFAASTTHYNHCTGWDGGDLYNVVAQIGKGAFATVYKMSTRTNGDLVAVKEIEKRKYLKDGILDRKVHNEIEIMRRVDHVSPSLLGGPPYTDQGQPAAAHRSLHGLS